MAAGPIPWSSMHRYCRAYGFSEEQEESAVYLWKRMDAAYLEHIRKKEE
jgi:hypothetical protein